MTTSRTSFIESYLIEFPQGINQAQMYPGIVSNIQDYISSGSKVIKVADNIYKTGNTVLYYWIGDQEGNQIKVGVELYIKDSAAIVGMLGKDPKLTGKAPFASDLYYAILHDLKKPIRLTSDTQMSNEGLGTWKRLLQYNCTVGVYNNQEPNEVPIQLHTPEELDAFFKHADPTFKSYQYVLSESGEQSVTVMCEFRLRKLRFLSGMSVED